MKKSGDGGERQRVTSGVPQLDRLLGDLFIGDNVVWYDDAGSLASPFCFHFIRASRAESKPVVYVSFDRSPRNLLEKLGTLAEDPSLILLDCFTHGKGSGSDVFLGFYEEELRRWPCRIVPVREPGRMEAFLDDLYGVHASLEGDVRFVFESITGMQELWGGEERVSHFYSRSCPRLYELSTIAYWIMERKAHSHRLRARINQIAQVAIELSIKRGVTSLTLLKAEERGLENLHQPHFYQTRDHRVVFEDHRRSKGLLNMGERLRELRTHKGLSQSELARLVGVTPSTISQVESNLIYPSVPALLKMAEVLSVEVSSFFRGEEGAGKRFVFSSSDAAETRLADVPPEALSARLLVPVDQDFRCEPYLLEIPPRRVLPLHFFAHKGEELGYLLEGELKVKMGRMVCDLQAGDVVVLASDIPSRWENPGETTARLLWVKVK